MKIMISSISLSLLIAAGAMAQKVDLSGTWKAKTTSARGTAEQTMSLKQKGNTFTGEMTTSQGTKEAIRDGTVNGDEIELGVERKQPDGKTAIVPYKGKVSGDEIKGTFTGASGREVEWSAKRE